MEKGKGDDGNSHEIKQTIISLVLDGSQEPDEGVGPRPVWFEISSLLSCIYALVITLLGVILPLVEASQERWLKEPVTGVFYAYLYLVGTVFLLYLQYVMANHTPQEGQERDVMPKCKANKPYSQGFVIESYKDESPFETISSQIVNIDSNIHSEHQNSICAQDLSQGILQKSSRFRTEPGTAMMGGAAVLFQPLKLRRNSSLPIISDGIINPQGKLQSNGDQNRTNYQRSSESFEIFNKRWHRKNQHNVSAIDLEGLWGMFGHGGSTFYLRFGTLVFGIGNIVYVALELEYHFSEEDCKTRTMSWIFILQLFFIIVQTFFMFKNPTIHVGSTATLARAGFMHLVGTNVCVWSRTLVSEVLHELLHHQDTAHGDNNLTSTVPNHMTGSRPYIQKESECEIEGPLMAIASPYLFPFVLEYSLISMTTAAIMFSSLADKTDKVVFQNIRNLVQTKLGLGKPSANQYSCEHMEHGSLLSKSHRGMFLGCLLLTGSIISMVMFFFAADDMHNIVEAQIIYLSCDIINHSLLLVATFIAFFRIRHMSFKMDRSLSIDDLLILIAMAGSFLFELMLIISTSSYTNTHHGSPPIDVILALVASIIAIVQTLFQVILVLASLRLYASNKRQVNEMPGRGTFTFLLIGNVAVWLFRSVQIKELEIGIQKDFYGHIMWVVMTNLSLPLLLFFRFHSSACFADIWEMAYKLKKS